MIEFISHFTGTTATIPTIAQTYKDLRLFTSILASKSGFVFAID